MGGGDMQDLMIKSGSRYRKARPAEIAEANSAYVLESMNRVQPTLEQPAEAARFLVNLLSGRDHEVFVVVFIDNRRKVICVEEMFRGTIDGASVHPREVVKAALWNSAQAVIFAHNHPSGVAEPSKADEMITRRLQDALSLIDVQVLDHMIVGHNRVTSFAQRGLI
jgi:DNA repair protein RadC